MKSENKLIKYSLLAAVVLVWGIIIFRLLNNTAGDKGKREVASNYSSQKEITTLDSFSILDNYPDPFIADPDSTEDTMSLKEKSAKVSPVNNIPVIPDLSFIKYSGLISAGTKKKKFAIINFRNQDIIMKEKNTIDGFKLVKIFKDSLIFTYRGENISIRKSE